MPTPWGHKNIKTSFFKPETNIFSFFWVNVFDGSFVRRKYSHGAPSRWPFPERRANFKNVHFSLGILDAFVPLSGHAKRNQCVPPCSAVTFFYKKSFRFPQNIWFSVVFFYATKKWMIREKIWKTTIFCWWNKKSMFLRCGQSFFAQSKTKNLARIEEKIHFSINYPKPAYRILRRNGGVSNTEIRDVSPAF